ncbi:hypothetical protein QAD02_019337 [Eretmocerus hayati]|uniref:Uncharacterized protein n=1 Tax=Eretmocerus hayati TaxID=131215 RepID=A0ACC2PIW8_9HYME|nr:hypothetical protein QAD02_019337 [Eretmocerus hayati]
MEVWGNQRLSCLFLQEEYPFATTGKIYCLANGSTESLADDQILSTIFWAPVGSALLYVLNNDIYYHQLDNESRKTRRLTFDGKHGAIYNGIIDVFSDEDELADGSSTWFSPDGRYLAFITLNDTQVPEAVITRYGKSGAAVNKYPKEERFRYSKPGTKKPQATLNLVDVTNASSSIVNLKAPVDIVGEDPIWMAVDWVDNLTVVATWTNRLQNMSQIFLYQIDGQFQLLLKQEVSNGWLLNDSEAPVFYSDYVVLLAPRSIGNDSLGNFSHLVRYRVKNDTVDEEVDLTPGGHWVHEIHVISKLTGVVYFSASPPSEPSQKQLYEVKIDEPILKCVSCDMKTPEGNLCKYVGSVYFSEDLSHFALTCSGPDPATIRIYNSNKTLVYEWMRNDEMRQMLSERKLPRKMDLTVMSHGFDSKVRLLLPSGFDPKSKKYPLLVHVYAGPESQQITDEFTVDLQQYLTTNREVIHAWIDGRGSCTRGTEILYAVYRNLGVAEIEDQIEVVRKLKDEYSWIDGDRIGIWGWSYGGYATAMVLTGDDDKIFKCGLSVAPVTSWLNYGSSYAERYMGLPTQEDNLEKYESSDVLSRVGNLQGKKFMLIHGTADNNVHFEHTMALTRALVDADVLYDQVVYPDEDHNLWGVWSHLYKTMDKFWSECFQYTRNEAE